MDWLSSLDLSSLLEYLYNPIVLIILGILFIVFMKLKRRFLAACILGLTGYYHVFQRLPTKTETSLTDLKKLFSVLGSDDLLIIIGGLLATTIGVAYIMFKKD
ncbi:MAG: hypothetical protein ABIG67_04550 [Pseudomonadota bacterium]